MVTFPRDDARRTFPDHEWCETHRHYKLGCAQYERLLERAGRRCEICRKLGLLSARDKLHIDHHGAPWAVRGLLCNACNSRLEDGSKTFPGSAEYLANTWWVQECRRLGVTTSIMPEPTLGSAIRDQFEIVWLRERDGKWRPQGRGRPGISWLSWEDIYRLRGPHNMAPFDLDGPESNDWLRWESERATGARA